MYWKYLWLRLRILSIPQADAAATGDNFKKRRMGGKLTTLWQCTCWMDEKKRMDLPYLLSTNHYQLTKYYLLRFSVLKYKASKTLWRLAIQQLEMEKFSGKLGEWQEFWDLFESAIHFNNGLSNVDKFPYLRNLLLEPARFQCTTTWQ